MCSSVGDLAARRAKRWRRDAKACIWIDGSSHFFFHLNFKPASRLPPEQKVNKRNSIWTLDVEIKYRF